MEGNRLAEKATLRREIREYIQRQIAAGRFQAGDRIVETQLAKELGVSQAPVREAILELAAMGLLEERPYSGSFVRKLTVEDIEGIYNTRAFLDEYAAKCAVQRITPPWRRRPRRSPERLPLWWWNPASAAASSSIP